MKNQTRKADEIILVDDHSSIEMPDAVFEFIQVEKVRFVRHECNKGLSAARNTAIGLSTGDYFTFCDDDDVWPNQMMELLYRGIDHVSGVPAIGIALAKKWRSLWYGRLAENPHLSSMMLEGITPPVSAQIYQTNLLNEIGGYNGNIRSGVDHDLWVRLLHVNPIVSVAWGAVPTIGRNPKSNRITNQESKRRDRIADALQIWRPTIVAELGQCFYNHFRRSYRDYLDFSFFMQTVSRRRWRNAAYRLRKPMLWKTIVRYLLSKIYPGKIKAVFPPYRIRNRKTTCG